MPDSGLGFYDLNNTNFEIMKAQLVESISPIDSIRPK